MVYTNRDNLRSGERTMQFKGSSDRISKFYRSPLISSRNASSTQRFDEHKSRRNDEPNVGNLSKFYRERFGSHSPEDYLNLRLSQFDKSLTKDNIRQSLEREFKALAPFEIKIVQNPEGDDRLAYINFERSECAKIVRRNMIPRLQKALGRRLALDPAGIIRDQEGKFIPDRYNRAAMAAVVDRTRSPRPQQQQQQQRRRAASPSNNRTNYSVVNSNSLNGIATPLLINGKRREVQFTNLNQDDTQASRTLFVGNLPGDVRETELKRIFEIYGTIENVDIKILQDSNAAFAFILYNTVEDAIEAKNCQHNKPVRPGSTKCQIGYGKSQVSQRLYIGGLGNWASDDLLMSEFDRFGTIDIIEYKKGDSYGFIRYENLESAIDACARMKHFNFGNEKYITIDFVKDNKKSRKRLHSNSDDDSNKHGLQTPSLSPGCSPTEAGYIKTFDELRDQIASTWRGIVYLKKCEYPLSFYRIFGKEHLLQDMLRDEAGNSLKLVINQRLSLDNAYYQRMIDLGKDELALMIAVETNERSPILSLIKYLETKNAAGVINIKGGNVHVMSHSIISERLLNFFSPRIALLKPGCNYLLVALKKNIAPIVSKMYHQSSVVQQPSELPPPPPLPSLGFLTTDTIKWENDEEKLPLREDRSAIQLQIKVKQEINSGNSPRLSANSLSLNAAPIPPPLPPQLEISENGGRNKTYDNDCQSSIEGENDHRRTRRHRKDEDDEEKEDEESDDESDQDDDDEDDEDDEDEDIDYNHKNRQSLNFNNKKINNESDEKKSNSSNLHHINTRNYSEDDDDDDEEEEDEEEVEEEDDENEEKND